MERTMKKTWLERLEDKKKILKVFKCLKVITSREEKI